MEEAPAFARASLSCRRPTPKGYVAGESMPPQMSVTVRPKSRATAREAVNVFGASWIAMVKRLLLSVITRNESYHAAASDVNLVLEAIQRCERDDQGSGRE